METSFHLLVKIRGSGIFTVRPTKRTPNWPTEEGSQIPGKYSRNEMKRRKRDNPQTLSKDFILACATECRSSGRLLARRSSLMSFEGWRQNPISLGIGSFKAGKSSVPPLLSAHEDAALNYTEKPYYLSVYEQKCGGHTDDHFYAVLWSLLSY